MFSPVSLFSPPGAAQVLFAAMGKACRVKRDMSQTTEKPWVSSDHNAKNIMVKSRYID